MKQALLTDFRVFLEMRNYSPTTIKSYVNVLGLYWRFCEEQGKTNPNFTKDKAVFLWFKHISQKYGAGTVFSQNYSSLKLFYTYILKRDWAAYGILRPRRGIRPLPEVMSLEEVDRLIEQTQCLKHRAALLMLYATGLRIGELVKVKIQDINAHNMTLKVNQGKGRKDRFLPLKQPILDILNQYREEYRPTIYLFNGYKNGQPLSPRAIQHAFQLAKDKAGLTAKVSPHTLRHAFATHHLDEGTHLHGVKSLLGHSNIKSTARYLHTSVQSLHQFNNPADQLCKKYII